MTSLKLLSPWRRFFQWMTALLVLLLPWFRINGKSLFRIDIPELSIYFFGQVLRIEELYLVFLAVFFLVLLFLLVTLVFGRVWCGWACPQTTLNDLAEWLARRLKLKVKNNRLAGALWRKVLIQALYMLLALLVAANLLWYFIEPRFFFSSLLSGDLPLAAWLTLLIVAATVYLDLALIRRLMCSDFCPYGRIQTSLVDPGTLTLHLPKSEIGRCIECGSCVRACPMGIDIRQGYQVECINCGRCLDACRTVMSRRNEEGLIRYSFGTEDRGARALVNPRTLLVSVAAAGIFTVLCLASLNRSVATLKVSRSHLVAERILKSGEQATFFNAWINNRGQEQKAFSLEALDPTGKLGLELKGQIRQVTIPAGDNRRIDFVVVSSPFKAEKEIQFQLIDESGTTVAAATATLSPIDRRTQ